MLPSAKYATISTRAGTIDHFIDYSIVCASKNDNRASHSMIDNSIFSLRWVIIKSYVLKTSFLQRKHPRCGICQTSCCCGASRRVPRSKVVIIQSHARWGTSGLRSGLEETTKGSRFALVSGTKKHGGQCGSD